MHEELRNASEIVKDPTSYSFFTYLWIAALSMWGGVVRIIRENTFGGKTKLEIARIFLFELITSGFAGVLTFYLCEAAGFQPLYTAAMTSIAGYMGGRSLAVIEAIYKAHQTGRKD